MLTRRSLARWAVATLALPTLRVAALEPATGPVVLTVSGKLARANAGSRAEFDMPMLSRLPQRSYSTATPWFDAPRKFSGPLLREVLAAVGAEGTLLRCIALNDYAVDLPVEDAQRHDVLLAILLDDKPMAVRDKGPLFIIYPFHTSPALRNAVYFSRSVWQLKSILVQ